MQLGYRFATLALLAPLALLFQAPQAESRPLKGSEIGGVVIGAGQAPVPGATVQITNLINGQVRVVITDEDGRFEETGFMPDEHPYTVIATSPMNNPSHLFTIKTDPSGNIPLILIIDKEMDKPQ